MVDCKGNVVGVGDEVVYVKGKNTAAEIATGKITKCYPGRFGDECSVGSQSHLTSKRIMRLNK